MIRKKRQRLDSAEETSSPRTTQAREDAGSTVNTSHASRSASQQEMATQQSGSSEPAPARETAKTVRCRRRKKLKSKTAFTDDDQLHKAKSWYGSWSHPPKATASTSVARENILGGTIRSKKAPDLSRFEPRKPRRPSDATSVRSLAAAVALLSNVPENQAGEPVQPERPSASSSEEPTTLIARPDTSSKPGDPTINANVEPEAQSKPSETGDLRNDTKEPTTPERPATSSGWLGWWSSTPFVETQTTTQNTTEAAPVVEEEPRPSTPTAQTPATEATATLNTEPSASTSWFGLWSTPAPIATPSNAESSQSAGKDNDKDVEMRDAPASDSKPAVTPKAGSTWAFWSRDSPQTTGQLSTPNPGQIAVMGEGSEARPTPMDEGNMAGTPTKETQAKDIPAGRSTWRRNKRNRPASMDISSGSPKAKSLPATDSNPGSGTQTPTAVEPPITKTETSVKSTDSESSTRAPPNLLLPSFEGTYRMKESSSILSSVASYLMRTEQPPANHVFRVQDPPKIKKALSIGVHGLFPATYLRPMIGQPTGTSLRFATLGADAIRKWADAHGSAECEIEKVALEGDGKIGDRVDNLWKLMLNWIEHIRKADLIIVACHSQGVPVSIMLLEKLIDLGIVTDAKIGVCAMAGVALGPFPEYKSNFLMGSASELWEFGDPKSTNSQRFEVSLRRVLDYGARITFIGSIDDQVVPMESAVYSPAHHPYIYRAVFIDGRVHAPDFIAHLVGFALKLRNLGISDHGLIRELSIPLAGSLYSGEGHSRLYYEPAVYDLAISHALETTTLSHARPVDIRERGVLGAPNPNPYILPWIMRGMLEEDFVKTELSRETDELLKQFDDWKPTNKALKDVKYRLEAVRSRL